MNDKPFEAPVPVQRQFPPRNEMLVVVRGVAGGIVGGIFGFFAFRWLAQNGFYGMMIPGAMIGLGAALAARGKSVLLGVLCAVAAIAVSLVAEWAFAPFIKDKSLTYFLTHVHQLRPLTMVMMGLGAAFAFWLGQGR